MSDSEEVQAANRSKWVAALRSGKYQQAQGGMKVSDEAAEVVARLAHRRLSRAFVHWDGEHETTRDDYRAFGRAVLEAAYPLLPARPMPTAEEIEEHLANAMADSWMGDEVDCADVATILTPAVLALLSGIACTCMPSGRFNPHCKATSHKGDTQLAANKRAGSEEES